MNVIARLEYELAYYDSAVHRFNHYTTRTLGKGMNLTILDSVMGKIVGQSVFYNLGIEVPMV